MLPNFRTNDVLNVASSTQLSKEGCELFSGIHKIRLTAVSLLILHRHHYHHRHLLLLLLQATMPVPCSKVQCSKSSVSVLCKERGTEVPLTVTSFMAAIRSRNALRADVLMAVQAAASSRHAILLHHEKV
jgi:hypothetical protein